MPDRHAPDAPPAAFEEVRIFIDPDGTVTFCDLWEGLAPVAEAVGDVTPLCRLPPEPPGPPGDAENR